MSRCEFANHRTEHLTEAQLLPIQSACLFCGSRQRTPIWTLQQSPDVTLLACEHCRAASVSHMPTSAALEDYYGTYYHKEGEARTAAKITFGDARRMARHLCRRVKPYLVGPHVKILDYGGGDGTIAIAVARELMRLGVMAADVVVVDYNMSLAEVQTPELNVRHCQSLDELRGGHHDLVIASAVLEHLAQPADALLSLLNLTRTGGMFYARTPCNVPLMKVLGVFGIKWEFFFPAHLHDLGQEFWEQLFAAAFPGGAVQLLESRPAIIESSLKERFLFSLASHLLKAPWYVIGSRYKLVGGWEVFVRRLTDAPVEYVAR